MPTMNAVAQHIRLTEPSLAPYRVWAGIGILNLLVQIYVYSSWIMSDHFARVSPPLGGDAMPWYTASLISAMQGGVVLSIVGIVVLVATTLRKRVFPNWGVMMLAWASCMWMDVIVNGLRPNFAYNQFMFNMGSWGPFVPGWLSPGGERMGQPILFNIFTWTASLPLFTLLVCYVLRTIKRRNPSISFAGLIAMAILGSMIWDGMWEVVFVRGGVFAYYIAIPYLTLWYGHWYQFPIITESVFWGIAGGLGAAFYYLRDDRGHMTVERGTEQLQSKTGAAIVRVLAVSGLYSSLCGVFFLFYVLSTLYLGPVPSDVPSYFRSTICGVGALYPCPDPSLPIYTRLSAPPKSTAR